MTHFYFSFSFHGKFFFCSNDYLPVGVVGGEVGATVVSPAVVATVGAAVLGAALVGPAVVGAAVVGPSSGKSNT